MSDMDPVTKEIYDAFVKLGYNHNVAEALAERGLSMLDVTCSTSDEVFKEYLEWNGFIGWHSLIRDALDNIRNVEAHRCWLLEHRRQR